MIIMDLLYHVICGIDIWAIWYLAYEMFKYFSMFWESYVSIFTVENNTVYVNIKIYIQTDFITTIGFTNKFKLSIN